LDSRRTSNRTDSEVVRRTGGEEAGELVVGVVVVFEEENEEEEEEERHEEEEQEGDDENEDGEVGGVRRVAEEAVCGLTTAETQCYKDISGVKSSNRVHIGCLPLHQ
jgi:hypothetical protein